MKQEDILKVLRGAAIAAAGAVLTYLSQWISGADFGVYTPTVVAVWSIVVNLLRKWLSPTNVKFAFLVATVLALQSGFAFAAYPKPVVKQKCAACGDSCACPEGFCPSRCAVKGDLAAANAAVARGEKVVLCIGVPGVEGAYATGSVKGYVNGVYDCYREKGVHLMQIRSASAVTYSVGNPFATPCSGGSCPAPSSRRR